MTLLEHDQVVDAFPSEGADQSLSVAIEASSTPTICSLSDSRRHQLPAITPLVILAITTLLAVVREKADAELARNARNPRDLISVPKILWRRAIDRSRRAAAGQGCCFCCRALVF
jgi:hypothetical protein